MPKIDQSDGFNEEAIWLEGPGRSIIAKVMISILLAGLAIFALLGYFGFRLQRRSLEAAALLSAEQQSEVLRRSASHYMLNNDRNGLRNDGQYGRPAGFCACPDSEFGGGHQLFDTTH